MNQKRASAQNRSIPVKQSRLFEDPVAGRHQVSKIVSGGQTGVDRGALEAAIELNLPHGGWCPRGRLSEDGTIPPRYMLVETDSCEYPVRTELNVVDSDGTLILYERHLSGGTELTYRLTRKLGRSCQKVDLTKQPSIADVRSWLIRNKIRVLNVAGPRESNAQGIQASSREFLLKVLKDEVQG